MSVNTGPLECLLTEYGEYRDGGEPATGKCRGDLCFWREKLDRNGVARVTHRGCVSYNGTDQAAIRVSFNPLFASLLIQFS